MKRVLFVVGIDGAPLRYRAHFAAEALALQGVQTWVSHYRSSDTAALFALVDRIVIYRVPATEQILGLIDAARTRGVPVLFDIDDLIFDPDIAERIPAVRALAPDVRALYHQGVRRYRTTMEACDAYIGSTAALVEHVERHVGMQAHRWWNGVGIGPARCSDIALRHPRTPGPLRIGYLSGTSTHDEDWRYVEAAVLEVLDRRPDVELWLGGLVEPTPAAERFGARVRRIPLKPWWELPWVLRDLDVNLAPLAPSGSFNEAKSAIKWLEAALTETPTVASPTAPFREVIEEDRTGHLAATPEQFTGAIVGLLDDRMARQRMARLARREALLRWSPHLQGRAYLDILERGALGRTKPSTWSAHEALDEPWIIQNVEDYIVPDPMVLAPVDPIESSTPAAVGDDRRRPFGRRVRDAARRAIASR